MHGILVSAMTFSSFSNLMILFGKSSAFFFFFLKDFRTISEGPFPVICFEMILSSTDVFLGHTYSYQTHRTAFHCLFENLFY